MQEEPPKGVQVVTARSEPALGVGKGGAKAHLDRANSGIVWVTMSAKSSFLHIIFECRE